MQMTQLSLVWPKFSSLQQHQPCSPVSLKEIRANEYFSQILIKFSEGLISFCNISQHPDKEGTDPSYQDRKFDAV